MGPRPVKAEGHLSDFESLMWTLESDPHLRSGFANITLLDQPADTDHFTRRMIRAATRIPQLRRRIVPGVLRLSPPAWADDPDFSIENHVHVHTLEAPGTLEQLAELAVSFTHRPYDMERPLWEFMIVDGLADGRGAMLQRMHHTITDGVGAVRMSEQFIDFSRTLPEVDVPPVVTATGNPAAPLHRLTDTVTHATRRHIGMMQRSIRGTVELGLHPSRVPATVQGAGRLVQALAREATDIGDRRSPLWTDRSLDRSMAMLSVPLDTVKAVAKRFDASVNDVFVAGAVGGAGAYHRVSGAPVDELRMAMPVNVRNDRSAAGNAFSMARVVVPTDPDPRVRLRAVHDRLATVRSSPAVSVVQSIAGLANLLPPGMLIQITKHQVSTVDFTTSNVRGAPIPVYIAGARVESNHPIGPLAGTAFNLTTLSYDGSLDMGLHMDRGAITEPDRLAGCVQDAFDELLAL